MKPRWVIVKPVSICHIFSCVKWIKVSESLITLVLEQRFERAHEWQALYPKIERWQLLKPKIQSTLDRAHLCDRHVFGSISASCLWGSQRIMWYSTWPTCSCPLLSFLKCDYCDNILKDGLVVSLQLSGSFFFCVLFSCFVSFIHFLIVKLKNC